MGGPSTSPTRKPSASPIIKVETTVSVDTVLTDTPTLKPTAVASNIISTTSSSMTTLHPTMDQADSSICCECLDPATENNRIKGCVVDPQCHQIICDFDDYCCQTLWDKTCTFYASEQCEKSIETTQVLAVEQSPATDFNLVWKFALVVLAVMVLIITCCCMLIYMHKMCRNWVRRNDSKHHKQQQQNHQIKRAQTEIVMPSNTNSVKNVGKKLVRVKTSVSQQRGAGHGHQRMRSTDNYSMRYEHNVMDTTMNMQMAEDDDLDDLESDDLKHEDLEDVSLRIRPQKHARSSSRQRYMMDENSLSNSESTSPNDEYYSKKRRKQKKSSKKKKKKRRKKRKSKRRKRKRNTNVDYDSSPQSSDNDDAGTEIMLKLQRSFSTSMLKRHSI